MTTRRKPQVSPAQAWCFTLNNWTESEYEFLSSTLSGLDGCEWIIGKEIGAEETPHLQGYAWRPGKWRPLPTLLVGDGRCHFERAKGDKDQNYDYCSKEGEFAGNLRRGLPSVTTLDAANEILGKTYEPGAYGHLREAAAVRLMCEDNATHAFLLTFD